MNKNILIIFFILFFHVNNVSANGVGFEYARTYSAKSNGNVFSGYIGYFPMKQIKITAKHFYEESDLKNTTQEFERHETQLKINWVIANPSKLNVTSINIGGFRADYEIFNNEEIYGGSIGFNSTQYFNEGKNIFFNMGFDFKIPIISKGNTARHGDISANAGIGIRSICELEIGGERLCETPIAFKIGFRYRTVENFKSEFIDHKFQDIFASFYFPL